ncbi:hypothetical protein [uncultured Muribaculum sp.]|uniref:hypothetical protein n=1 Tax=uncultured Muribaculum sp. TaxID=1918613 RepID=UPI0025B739A6|nr:hypothetical protein [uncultured Muribaculum sp.]
MNDNSNNVTVTIESLNIRYNNHRDENRQYDIAASFSVRGTNIDSINNGVVSAKKWPVWRNLIRSARPSTQVFSI